MRYCYCYYYCDDPSILLVQCREHSFPHGGGRLSRLLKYWYSSMGWVSWLTMNWTPTHPSLPPSLPPLHMWSFLYCLTILILLDSLRWYHRCSGWPNFLHHHRPTTKNRSRSAAKIQRWSWYSSKEGFGKNDLNGRVHKSPWRKYRHSSCWRQWCATLGWHSKWWSPLDIDETSKAVYCETHEGHLGHLFRCWCQVWDLHWFQNEVQDGISHQSCQWIWSRSIWGSHHRSTKNDEKRCTSTFFGITILSWPENTVKNHRTAATGRIVFHWSTFGLRFTPYRQRYCQTTISPNPFVILSNIYYSFSPWLTHFNHDHSTSTFHKTLQTRWRWNIYKSFPSMLSSKMLSSTKHSNHISSQFSPRKCCYVWDPLYVMKHYGMRMGVRLQPQPQL